MNDAIMRSSERPFLSSPSETAQLNLHIILSPISFWLSLQFQCVNENDEMSISALLDRTRFFIARVAFVCLSPSGRSSKFMLKLFRIIDLFLFRFCRLRLVGKVSQNSAICDETKRSAEEKKFADDCFRFRNRMSTHFVFSSSFCLRRCARLM